MVLFIEKICFQSYIIFGSPFTICLETELNIICFLFCSNYSPIKHVNKTTVYLILKTKGSDWLWLKDAFGWRY